MHDLDHEQYDPLNIGAVITRIGLLTGLLKSYAIRATIIKGP